MQTVTSTTGAQDEPLLRIGELTVNLGGSS